MARANAVWGIDVGQCALKALRCIRGDDPDSVVAVAFDYIEYPKILSQPDANPQELIQEALKQFLSRNSVRGDKVAISVSGQSGLARFIKLPPVESKKIPDIVKYEARQQIPFALEDVIWDYQRMAGGSEEDGFSLETEVGLFAMKREQVYRALEPFKAAEIDVDYVQLTPLALYNYVAFDHLRDLPPADEYDPDNPPESIVVTSIGTDNTDLVVTNGYRVWQRSIPLGGNHFTKALTKELKLTFAKAEHLKRNIAQSAEQKPAFQAMRPIFNDLITELQRSINHFRNIDRSARIGRVVALGNAMKLMGLQRFMAQQLGLEVVKIDKFRGLTGADVVDAPAFNENLLGFATCYGLTLQGLRDTRIRTNLVPREIVRDRLIQSKKPAAVGAAAILLLGFSLGCLGDWRAWRSVHKEEFNGALSGANSASSLAQSAQQAFDSSLRSLEETKKTGENLTSAQETDLKWAELIRAIEACVSDDAPGAGDEIEDLTQRITQRNRVYITSIMPEFKEDMGAWYRAVQPKGGGGPSGPTTGGQGGPPPPGAPADGASPQGDKPHPVWGKAKQPNGRGWVVEIKGFHYHNATRDNERAQFVRNTILKKLQMDEVVPPGSDAPVPVGLMGIGFPVLLPNTAESQEQIEIASTDDNKRDKKKLQLLRFDFTIQFAWKDVLPERNPRDGRPGDQPSVAQAPPP